jgi:4-oxalocrotonate tautomerase
MLSSRSFFEEIQMPYLNVKLCTSPSREVSTKVAAVLTELTVEVLRKKRELTAVVIEYVHPSDWFIAGVTLSTQGQRTFCLDVRITEDTNTEDENALYVSRVFSSMETILGSLNLASYVVIHDIRGKSWGD